MKGLTLIELMICTALLVIFLSVGIPGTHELIEKYEAKSAVKQLKGTLMSARALALNKRVSVTVCPISNTQCINNWNDPITAFSDSNNNQILDPDETPYFSTKLDTPAGYWQKKRINAPKVNFSPEGHAFATATTFLYCPYSTHNHLAKQLVINFQGRIRVDNYLSNRGLPYANISPLTCHSEE